MARRARTLAAAALAILAGCAPDPGGASPGAARPLVLGIPVPESPAQRIVPANSSALEYLAVLVSAERIAAIPDKGRVYSNLDFEAAPWSSLPRFAAYQGEDILAHTADLVISHTWQDTGTTGILQQHGVPVAQISDFHRFEDLAAILTDLGTLLHVPERAAAVVSELRQRRADLERRAPDQPLRALTYSNFGSGGWTAGRNTSQDVLLQLAGLTNAAAEAGLTGHRELHHETLLVLDPDLIVVGSAESDPGQFPSADYLHSEAVLQGLQAVQRDRIVRLPARLYSTNSLYLLDAAEEVIRQVEALGGEE